MDKHNCGKEVGIKVTPDMITVYLGSKEIAVHNRCFEKNKSNYELEHYLPLLERKGRAIFNAKPVRDNLPAYFLEWLQKQDLAPKELVELLRRCLQHGCERVMSGELAVIDIGEMNSISDIVTVKPADLSA